jgi:hypothetical protein
MKLTEKIYKAIKDNFPIDTNPENCFEQKN